MGISALLEMLDLMDKQVLMDNQVRQDLVETKDSRDRLDPQVV